MTIWAIKGTIILQKPVNKDNQSHAADCKDSSIRPKEQKKSKIIIDSTGKKLNRSGWSVMINPEAVGMDKNSKRKSSKSTTKGHTKWQSNRQTRGENSKSNSQSLEWTIDSVRLTSSTQHRYLSIPYLSGGAHTVASDGWCSINRHCASRSASLVLVTFQITNIHVVQYKRSSRAVSRTTLHCD